MLAPARINPRNVAFMIALICTALLCAVSPAQAITGARQVLVVGNQGSQLLSLSSAIEAEPGVAVADSFDATNATPTADMIDPYDLVVSIGDSSYDDPALWGDRLADYVDEGGTVLQAAYDNWEEPGAAPTGRFASAGYAPLLNGNNENEAVSLGEILVPTHALVQGLGVLPTTDNTTTPLAPGATLLAKWSDGRNAIAYKGRVVAISASPGDPGSVPGIARLARNTSNYTGRVNVTVAKSGTGLGTVTGPGIDCGTLCSFIFADGAKPVFTASPAPEFQFKGWTGACTGTGPCAPVLAGSDLSVGAVFDLASFAANTNVTLAALSTKVSKNGQLKVRIRSGNDFSVTGTVSASTAGKVRTAALRYVKLKPKKAQLQAKGSKTVVLTLPKSLRTILIKKGKLKLLVTAKVKSPSGELRTVKKRVAVKPKG